MTDHEKSTKTRRLEQDVTMSTTSSDSQLQLHEISLHDVESAQNTEQSETTTTGGPSYQRVFRLTMLIGLLICFVIACVTIIPTTLYYVKWKDTQEATNNHVLLESVANVVVFGDSFSDTGNVYAASNQTSPETPPYWEGRYSNGRIYVDFLQDHLGSNTTIQTYAWGGATTNKAVISGYSTFLDGPVPSVDDQIASFLEEEAAVKSEDDSTLFILNIGYNDYWWYVYRNFDDSSASQPSIEDMETFAENVTTALVANVETLHQSKFGQNMHFLIANLPPMADFPEAVDFSDDKLLAYRYLTERHNTFLGEKLGAFQLAAKDATFELLDVHSLFASLLENPAQYGFKPVEGKQTACLSDDNNMCSDPFGSIFWDFYHPTTHTHFLIFEDIQQLLRNAR